MKPNAFSTRTTRKKESLGSNPAITWLAKFLELLPNLVFESFWSCGCLAFFGGFNSVFERDACDDFGEVVKAA
jgi:hypothetical protein